MNDRQAGVYTDYEEFPFFRDWGKGARALASEPAILFFGEYLDALYGASSVAQASAGTEGVAKERVVSTDQPGRSVFVVLPYYRGAGNDEPVGVFSTRALAEDSAAREKNQRVAGPDGYEIFECVLDKVVERK